MAYIKMVAPKEPESFPSNLNILIGRNGTGKTSVLNDFPHDDKTFFIHKEISNSDLLNTLYPNQKIDVNIDDSKTQEIDLGSGLNIRIEPSRSKRDIKSELNQRFSELVNNKNFVFKDGNSRFENLGDGYSRMGMFALLSEYLSRKKNRFTVLIDEPELHLHDSLLKDLSKIIFKISLKHRVIITTHSERLFRLLSQREGAEIFFQSRNKSRFFTYFVDKKGIVDNINLKLKQGSKTNNSFYDNFKILKGSSYKSITFHQQKSLISEVINDQFIEVLICLAFKNDVVIGEGIAELTLANHIGVDSLTAYGKPFVYTYLLILGLLKRLMKNKYLCLYDLDYKGPNLKNGHQYFNDKIAASLQGSKIVGISSRSNLEDSLDIPKDQKQLWPILLKNPTDKIESLIKELKEKLRP